MLPHQGVPVIKLAEMVKRILYGLVLIVVLGLCYFGLRNYRQRRAMMSGEVTGGPSETSSPEPISPDPSVPLPQPAPATAVPSPPVSRSATGAPATDTLPANPLNGMAYSGSGHFQVYRQGNLTFRLNTDTGESCVLYATNEEWRKPQVYGHGCAKNLAR